MVNSYKDKYIKPDLNFYTTEMAKANKEKLFFLDKVDDYNLFIDIGCANGILADKVGKPSLCFDVNPDILNLEPNKERIKKYSKHKKFKKALLKNANKSSLLLLSSVLHEVYNGDEGDINKFWNLIAYSNANYIAVRDMRADNMGRLRSVQHIFDAIDKHIDPKKIKSFKKHQGHLRANTRAMEFLLKYRYDINW